MRFVQSTWFALLLYGRLVSVQIRSKLQYRVSFLFNLAGTIFSTSIAFAALALVFQRFDHIVGWTLVQVAFLYGTIETSFGVMDLVFSGFDPSVFAPQMVQRGGFDRLLLRPVNVTLQVLGSDVAVRHLGKCVQGLVILGIALAMNDVRWTPAKIAYLPLVMASLVCFFGGLFIAGSTITFWTVQRIEAVNILTYGGHEMMSYPMHIYAKGLRYFFTYIIPAIFLNYYPALYFLDKPDPLGMPSIAPFLSPVVGFGTLALALAFWRFGIRRYTSTGT
jgi:ABC-2 type transport system permease protein